jgi:hypothetical protein
MGASGAGNFFVTLNFSSIFMLSLYNSVNMHSHLLAPLQYRAILSSMERLSSLVAAAGSQLKYNS